MPETKLDANMTKQRQLKMLEAETEVEKYIKNSFTITSAPSLCE